MTSTRTQRVWDIVERVLWTLLQVGAAEALVSALRVPQQWVLVIAPVIATVKGLLASKFATTSAATLPSSLDAGADNKLP